MSQRVYKYIARAKYMLDCILPKLTWNIGCNIQKTKKRKNFSTMKCVIIKTWLSKSLNTFLSSQWGMLLQVDMP